MEITKKVILKVLSIAKNNKVEIIRDYLSIESDDDGNKSENFIIVVKGNHQNNNLLKFQDELDCLGVIIDYHQNRGCNINANLQDNECEFRFWGDYNCYD